MAKINQNGQTISEKPTQKNSAKSTLTGINNLLNLFSGSMNTESADNAKKISTIISML